MNVTEWMFYFYSYRWYMHSYKHYTDGRTNERLRLMRSNASFSVILRRCTRNRTMSCGERYMPAVQCTYTFPYFSTMNVRTLSA